MLRRKADRVRAQLGATLERSRAAAARDKSIGKRRALRESIKRPSAGESNRKPSSGDPGDVGKDRQVDLPAG
jgi:hypothetical protein